MDMLKVKFASYVHNLKKYKGKQYRVYCSTAVNKPVFSVP
jgi:hypothetical protein